MTLQQWQGLMDFMDEERQKKDILVREIGFSGACSRSSYYRYVGSEEAPISVYMLFATLQKLGIDVAFTNSDGETYTIFSS